MSDGNESPVNQQEASPLPVPVSPDGEEYEYTYNITISYPGGKEKVFSVNAWKPLSVSFPYLYPLPNSFSSLLVICTVYVHYAQRFTHHIRGVDLSSYALCILQGARRTFLRSDFTFGSLGPEECARTVFSLRKIFSLPGEYLGKKSDKFEGKTEEKEEKDDKDQVSDVTASSDDVSTSLYWDVWEAIESVVTGHLPTTRNLAISLAAYQMIIDETQPTSPEDFILGKHFSKRWMANLLKIQSDAFDQYKSILDSSTRLSACRKYLRLLSSTPLYGTFHVTSKLDGSHVTLALSISDVLIFDNQMKVILQRSLLFLASFIMKGDTLILDFGVHYKEPISLHMPVDVRIYVTQVFQNFQKRILLMSGRVNREITIPVLYGEQAGGITPIKQNLSNQVGEFLKVAMKEKLPPEEQDKIQTYALFYCGDSQLLENSTLLGAHNIKALMTVGVELRKKKQSFTIILPDGSSKSVDFTPYLRAKDIVEEIAFQLRMSPLGLNFFLENQWANPYTTFPTPQQAKSLQEGHLDLFLLYQMIPLPHSRHNDFEISQMYYSSLERFRKGLIHLEKEDIIQLAAYIMVVQEDSHISPDASQVISTYVPEKWRDSYNLEIRIGNVFERIPEELTATQAKREFLTKMGPDGRKFKVTENGTEVYVTISQTGLSVEATHVPTSFLGRMYSKVTGPADLPYHIDLANVKEFMRMSHETVVLTFSSGLTRTYIAPDDAEIITAINTSINFVLEARGIPRKQSVMRKNRSERKNQ